MPGRLTNLRTRPTSIASTERFKSGSRGRAPLWDDRRGQRVGLKLDTLRVIGRRRPTAPRLRAVQGHRRPEPALPPGLGAGPRGAQRCATAATRTAAGALRSPRCRSRLAASSLSLGARLSSPPTEPCPTSLSHPRLTLCPLSDVAGHAAEIESRKIRDLRGAARPARLNESRVNGRIGRRLFSLSKFPTSWSSPATCGSTRRYVESTFTLRRLQGRERKRTQNMSCGYSSTSGCSRMVPSLTGGLYQMRDIQIQGLPGI